MQKDRGCNGKSRQIWYIGNKTYKRCPMKQITVVSWRLLTAYSFYKQGLLPNGRGWIYETEKFSSAMALIGNEYAQLEINEAKKARSRHGRHGSKNTPTARR